MNRIEEECLYSIAVGWAVWFLATHGHWPPDILAYERAIGLEFLA